MLENQKPILLEQLGMMFTSVTSTRKYRYGLYKCTCGAEFKCRVDNIKSSSTKSCGCLAPKVMHGKSSHLLYNIWANMHHRCNNKNNEFYKDYGGRGIKVCDRWKDIDNFIEDMHSSFSKGLSLDRRNNDGNYEPSNCRWATKTEQQRNTRVLMGTNKSGYRGVSFNKKANRWVALIHVNSKKIYLGSFVNKIDAAISYDKYVLYNNLEHTVNNVL